MSLDQPANISLDNEDVQRESQIEVASNDISFDLDMELPTLTRQKENPQWMKLVEELPI